MSKVFNVEEIFGKNVFTLGKMKERLPKNVYKEVVTVMNEGGELSKAAANVVAKEMKDWAVENGVTAGVAPGRFGPDMVCTRAQIVTFLYSALA